MHNVCFAKIMTIMRKCLFMMGSHIVVVLIHCLEKIVPVRNQWKTFVLKTNVNIINEIFFYWKLDLFWLCNNGLTGRCDRPLLHNQNENGAELGKMQRLH